MNPDRRTPHTIWSFKALAIILAIGLAHMAASWGTNIRLGRNIIHQIQQQQFETGRYPVLEGLSSVLSFPLSQVDRAVIDMTVWHRIGPAVFVLNSLIWGLAIYLLARLLLTLAGRHKNR